MCMFVHKDVFLIFCMSICNIFQISVGCPKIRVLHINQCGILSNMGIEAVGKGCPELEDLSMDQCKQVGCSYLYYSSPPLALLVFSFLTPLLTLAFTVSEKFSLKNIFLNISCYGCIIKEKGTCQRSCISVEKC